jgi:hypothetical protein
VNPSTLPAGDDTPPSRVERAPYEAPALGPPVSLAATTLFSGAVTDAGVVFGGG